MESNTIDVEMHIYSSPFETLFRIVAKTSPDFPGVVELVNQEMTSNEKGYMNHGTISFDKEMWDKVKYAVDTVFEKSV